MTENISFREISTRLFRLGVGLLTAGFLLSACAPAPSVQATPDINAALTQVVATVMAAGTQTEANVPAALEPTGTPTAGPGVVPVAGGTPPALPGVFTTSILNPLDAPHTYIKDTCQALKAKWDPNNAAPGTVVMVIMFHGVIKGVASDDKSISMQDFKKLMSDLHQAGFEAIDTQQLSDFLYTNAKIPSRSVLLTVDDRHRAQSFTDTFLTYYNQWGWKVVNGWISAFGAGDPYLAENVALSDAGWVDYQAHGVVHNIPMADSSSDEYLKSELQGSIDNIQSNFHKTPIAIIWPGGGFGIRPVTAALQYGFKLGFTVNPRGPLMFNWIPQADADDPARPSYLAEGPAGDPLMTLPRFWDTDARAHLDAVRNIGDQAAAYAGQNKATELAYYNIACASTYGALPQP